MYKKFLTISAAMALAVCLVGCGGSDNDGSASSSSSGSSEPSSAAVEPSESESASSGAVYDERLSPALSDAEKELTEVIDLGQLVSTDEYDLVLSEWYWDKPGDGDSWEYAPGAHTYGDSSMNMLVMRGTYTNKRTDPIALSTTAGGTYLVNDEYSYTARIAFKATEIAPLETEDVFVYAEVPDAMKEQFANAELFLGMNKAGKSVTSASGIDVMYQLDFS